MLLGVVLRRQPSRHPWADHSWRPVAVIPGAPAAPAWRLLRRDGECVDYLAAALPLQLYPGETPGYLQNLSQRAPAIYIVLRPLADGDAGVDDCPVRPFHVTACPVEAQDYLDGDDRVDVVPMPGEVAAWIADFARRHHVERPFHKRRRKDRTRDPADGGPDGTATGGGSHE